MVHKDRGLQTGQGTRQFEDDLAAIVRGAVEEVAVGRDQHGRFELGEALGGGPGA